MFSCILMEGLVLKLDPEWKHSQRGLAEEELMWRLQLGGLACGEGGKRQSASSENHL